MTLRGKKYALPKDDTLVADLQRTDTRPYEIVVLSGIFNEADAKIIASAASVKHFIVPELAAAYRAFNSLYKAGQKVTPESLAMEMESNGSMAREEASNVVDTLVAATPPRSIKHSIRALGRVQKRQAFYELVEYLRTPDALRDDLDGAMAHIHGFMSLASVTSGRKVATLAELIKKALERTEPEKVWYPYLLGDIQKYWKIRKGSYTVIAADSGHGKAQPLDAKVLTPAGFVRMGDIKPGSVITDSAGGPQRVIGVYPQGVLPVYKVTMSDGGSTECCGEHLWRVSTNNHRKRGTYVIKDTKSLMSDLRQKQSIDKRTNGEQKMFSNKWAVPHSPGVMWRLNDDDLPLHPYVLGALLGDGSLKDNAVILHNPEKDVQLKVNGLLPEGSLMSCGDGITCRITGGAWHNNPVLSAIRRLGLDGKRSWEKYIPEPYLMTTSVNRLWLLRGLCDTDGYVNHKQLEYSTSSPQLAKDVEFLVRSLGGMVRTVEKDTAFTYNGEKREGRISYRMSISMPEGVIPVSSDKHLSKYVSARRGLRTIESIELIGHKECQCIAVESVDHLYVTDDFIVTHNTAAMVNLALGMVRQNTHVGVISLEMTGEELAYRAAAIEAGVDGTRFEDGILTEGELDAVRHELQKNADIYSMMHVLDPSACAAEDLPGMYNELVKEYECEVIFLDYIQRVTTRDKSAGGKYDAVSKASATVTELTKSLNVATIALSLLARDRDNSKKGLHHLKESGQIGADAATVIIMTMLGDDDDFTNPEKQIECRAVKNRKGLKFKHMLTLHGPTQQFHEPTAGSQFPSQS